MKLCPCFNFYVGHPAVNITHDDVQWSMPLPVNRQEPAPPITRSVSEMTYGDYFQAAADFLTHHLTGIISTHAGTALPAATSVAVQDVDIHLIKHGAFYHPARITVHTDQKKILMVLNVAVVPQGRTLMDIETANLRRLNHHAVGREVIPKVFAQGEGHVPGKPSVPMFAAQWFDGYCEFHICANQDPCGGRIWKVWDEHGHWLMTPDQVAALYQRAAFILTACYHPLTFEAILDWHHAAGDFIVQRDGHGLDVRLITVRRYSPLCDMAADNGMTLTDILDALVLFLLDLTLRMRLDRQDGVGRLVWAENWVVPHVWQGFVRGLDRMASLFGLPVDFVDGVFHYLAAHGVVDLVGLGRSVAARFGKLPEETVLIHNHLTDHAALLKNLIDKHGTG